MPPLTSRAPVSFDYLKTPPLFWEKADASWALLASSVLLRINLAQVVFCDFGAAGEMFCDFGCFCTRENALLRPKSDVPTRAWEIWPLRAEIPTMHLHSHLVRLLVSTTSKRLRSFGKNNNSPHIIRVKRRELWLASPRKTRARPPLAPLPLRAVYKFLFIF